MFDLLDYTVSPVLSNIQVCYNLNDKHGLEQNARLALKITSDTRSNAIANIALGVARQELQPIEGAIRSLEWSYDYGNAAVALCVLAVIETRQVQRIVALHKAQENIIRSKMKLAQCGNTIKWKQACDIEIIIQNNIKNFTDAQLWIDGEVA